MQVVLWLTNKNISEWSVTAEQADRLQNMLPSGTQVRRCLSKEEFLTALPEANVAVVWRFDQQWLETAPKLQLLATPSAGQEYLAFEPPSGLRILFGAFHGEIMAETVLGMVLGLSRGLLKHARELSPPRNELWPRESYSGQLTRLRGSHMVILGFGKIGEWVARYAKAFGARITGIRRKPASARPDFFEKSDRVLGMDALDSVLPEADHLVMVLPATPETDKVMDARRLALLPQTAFLYNVGRGNSIDEKALAEALRAGRIRGAALDVCAVEPLPAESMLRTAPNCYIYPHVSALAPDYLDIFFDELVEEISSLQSSRTRAALRSNTPA